MGTLGTAGIYFPQFWKLKVRDQDAASLGSGENPLLGCGLLIVPPHVAELRGAVSSFLALRRALVSLMETLP